MTIKQITPEEHRQRLAQEVKDKGLYHAVKECLDEIMLDMHGAGYLDYSHASEMTDNILMGIGTSGKGTP